VGTKNTDNLHGEKLMWYSIAFIGGAFLGILVMAVFASSTLDKLEWENARLSKNLSQQDSQLA